MSDTSPAAMLHHEIASMQALRSLLEREQQCLAAGDTDGCAALLDDKAALLAELGRRARARHDELAAAGFPPSELGMQLWLAQSQEGEHAAWNTLLDITRDAHGLNRINGLLLAGLSARNRQALAALGASSDGPGLYGPAGQTEHALSRAARAAG